MYCTTCGKQNLKGSEFCKYCGIKLKTSEVYTSNETPYPYVISIWKLVILSVLTFNLYNIYWFYKQWKSLKAERNLKVTPWARALFASILSYSLFKEVSKAVKSVDKTHRGLEAGGLAIAYFILVFLYRLPEPYWLLSTLSILPLIPAQKAINFYWQKKYSDKVVPSRFGVWNLIWAIAGGTVFVLALIGTFGNSNSASTSNNSNTSQTQNSQNKTDNTQSVVDITCDNQEGGSGTIISQSGYVLTNNHVIKGATSCLITLPDTTTGQPKAIYTAKPVIIPNLSQQYDLAFLNITGAYTDENGKTWGTYPTKFPAFNFTNSCTNYTPHLGDYVRIYGYPVTSGGYNLTITDGIISSFDDNNDILTSAKIDSGNSGGLAVSKDGCFVGVPSAVVAGNYQNLGVIIPASIVGDFANKLETPYQSSNNATSENQAFDVSCLSLNNGQMYGNSYYNNNPTYIASLYNGCSQAVKNVVIKVNFYAASDSNGTTPLDTEYVDLGITYLGSGDAHAINGTISTPFDTSGNFNWDVQVYSADPY